METVTFTIDIPDRSFKDCEACNITPQKILQVFVTQLSTACTVLTVMKNYL
jgi:hypothetical protein